MFKILESHSNHTSNEVEDENSHPDNPSTNSFLSKGRHSVDNIHFFGPNLKSEKRNTGSNVTSFDCS